MKVMNADEPQSKIVDPLLEPNRAVKETFVDQPSSYRTNIVIIIILTGRVWCDFSNCQMD